MQEAESRSVFERKSPWNFGVEYQLSEATRLGAYALYGSEIGISASFALNPSRTLTPINIPAPPPLAVRPSQEEYPELWTTEWTESTEAQSALGTRLNQVLEPEGFRVQSFGLTAYEAEARVENTAYRSTANAIGRIARGMALVLPLTVETFNIVLVDAGLPISTVTVRRTDLETAEALSEPAEALRPLVGITAAATDGAPARSRRLLPAF